jgi:hypothetical protein
MQFSEVSALRTRQVLAGVWLVILVSLFHDPWSPVLTSPDSPVGPLAAEAHHCVAVQNHCAHSHSYPIGAPMFWGLLLPVLIAVLFLFGHEFWRRICPLSFFSQFGRSLDRLRRRRPWSNTGTVPAQVRAPKIAPDSWLGRHHLSLQFGLFYVALCGRILFVNSHRISLALFMLSFIVAAAVVGFLYDGKTWCQYVCPVAPVEAFYTGPRGLFGSRAHVKNDPAVKVSQSMCRTVASPGAPEKSACVACKANCIDIDAEKTYWLSLMQPDRQRLYYGYAGLVVAYFAYYFLYAGNWAYYFSGLWSHEADQHAHLLDSGFAVGLGLVVGGHTLILPKLLAVPLVLGGGALGGYALGRLGEALLARRQRASLQPLSREMLRHRCFTLTTFGIFNFFFVFGGYNLRALLPAGLAAYIPVLLSGLSALWLYRTWYRSPDDYSREVMEQKQRGRRPKPAPAAPAAAAPEAAAAPPAKPKPAAKPAPTSEAAQAASPAEQASPAAAPAPAPAPAAAPVPVAAPSRPAAPQSVRVRFAATGHPGSPRPRA